MNDLDILSQIAGLDKPKRKRGKTADDFGLPEVDPVKVETVKRGRPAEEEPEFKRYTIYINDSMKERMFEIARQEGVQISALYRAFVDAAIRQYDDGLLELATRPTGSREIVGIEARR